MMAKLVRFYGLTPDDIYETDCHTIGQLSAAISAIQAQETMALFKVADWPNLKKEARAKLFRDLNKAANPIRMEAEQKPLNTADLAKLLNGR
jgi:hypothetical protein